ncbi:hypothetical protein LY76DRAFT_360189 [Colletotrichum caudatum]|nr:hypothetical protein LY76DRAFT_360189 [Colletotrichum caudatum]
MTIGGILKVFAHGHVGTASTPNPDISLDTELASNTKKGDSHRVSQGEKRKRSTPIHVKLLLISRGSTTRRGEARAQKGGNGTRHQGRLSFPCFGVPTQLDLRASSWCSDQRQDICMLKLGCFLSRLIGSNIIHHNQPVVSPVPPSWFAITSRDTDSSQMTKLSGPGTKENMSSPQGPKVVKPKPLVLDLNRPGP